MAINQRSSHIRSLEDSAEQPLLTINSECQLPQVAISAGFRNNHSNNLGKGDSSNRSSNSNPNSNRLRFCKEDNFSDFHLRLVSHQLQPHNTALMQRFQMPTLAQRRSFLPEVPHQWLQGLLPLPLSCKSTRGLTSDLPLYPQLVHLRSPPRPKTTHSRHLAVLNEKMVIRCGWI